MKLYSIALPSDLKRATTYKLRERISKVARNYADLISGRLDRAYSEAVVRAADSSPDTPAVRAWLHTIARLTQEVTHEQSVPHADLLPQFNADSPDVGRLFELVCWEGVGAACARRSGAFFDLPGAPPQLLSVNLEGAFEVGEVWPTSGTWSLTATEEVCLTGPAFTATSSSASLWKANIQVAGKGIDAFIPLSTPALTNRDFQEFPMIRSWAYAKAWSPVLQLAGDAIDEYSKAAAACVRELVHCVVPLVGTEEVVGSASREQALGLVFLPGTDRQDQVTECLLHEAMHQYLFRLEECGDLFTSDNDTSESYYSPWRNDPRPLRMTLHGAFVFSAVSDLYQSASAPEILHIERRECLRRSYHRARQVRQALGTVVRHAKLTAFGQIVVDAVEQDLARILDAVEPAKADRALVDSIVSEHSERYVQYAR